MEINYKRRQRIALIISFIILWYMFFVFPKYSRDDSDGITATCTVTKAYTKERGGTVSGMNDIRPKGFLRQKNAVPSQCMKPQKAGRFPPTLQQLSLAKNIYSMSQTHHLKKNAILIRPALKKSKNNNLIN